MSRTIQNTTYAVQTDVVSSEQNLQIEEGTLLTVNGVLKHHSGGQSKEVMRPYKVYTALLTQSGTDAPVATVLENTIGDIVWSRGSEGNYLTILNNAFPLNKTFILNGIATDGDLSSIYNINIKGITDSEIAVRTLSGLTESDGLLNNTPIEIRVYN